MSNIKYLRSKAVKEAWEREIELVKQGFATRDWTLEQQKELLLTHRIKGFIGHHVKPVNRYPELAGDPANIQFLTKKEHFEAHLHNWSRSIGHFFDINTKDSIRNEMYFPMFRRIKLTKKLILEKNTNNNLEEEHSMSMSKEELRNKYYEFYSIRKKQLISVFEKFSDRSPAEMTSLTAILFNLNLSNQERADMSAAYSEMKNKDISLAEAYCNGFATLTFNKQVASKERYVSHGTMHNTNELQEFSNEMKEFCQSRINSLETSQSQARELYSKQAEVWSESNSRQEALHQSQSKHT